MLNHFFMTDDLAAAWRLVNVSELARRLDLSTQSVNRWRHTRVPAEYVVAVERLTRIPREQLRPDIFGKT